MFHSHTPEFCFTGHAQITITIAMAFIDLKKKLIIPEISSKFITLLEHPLFEDCWEPC